MFRARSGWISLGTLIFRRFVANVLINNCLPEIKLIRAVPGFAWNAGGTWILCNFAAVFT